MDAAENAVVLVNVRYRLDAQAKFAGHHDSSTWPPHAYHDVFNRYLERGQYCSSRRESALTSVWIQMERTHVRCYQVRGESGRRPGEGKRWPKQRIHASSAARNYVGTPAGPKLRHRREGRFHPETRVCETENHELPRMLRRVFGQMQDRMSWN